MSDPVPLLNVQIDGVWRQFPKGTRVIEACAQAGKFVPRYCYHPKLTSPGNCRMCLIEMGMPKMGPDKKPELGEDGKPVISWIPRPQISCAQDIAEGMGVRTDSPLARECRNGVMEFLLINHPLDCPICDQAGECRLQEFSVQFGTAGSRFLEDKVKKPKRVKLGPRVTLDDERCILCSRCIRFMQEVAKDDVLGFVSRGGHTYLTAHPERPLDSNYSLNTVDICPVGALTSTDFRFKMRVWFLKETKSICTSCATGCNTLISAREDVIYRQTPRENDDVNSCWMCDFGRLNFHYVNSEDRLKAPLVRLNGRFEVASWTSALSRVADALRRFPGDQVAVIASARMTNEELWLARQLIETLGTPHHDVVPRQGEADDILLNADRNPNLAGATMLGVASGNPGERLAPVATKVRSGEIKAVLALGEDLLEAGFSIDDLDRLSFLCALNILPNPTTQAAMVVLPGATFAEKRGSMINAKGRLQRLNRAIRSPGNAHDDWEILRDLLQHLSARSSEGSSEGSSGRASGRASGTDAYFIEDLFKQLAGAVPAFRGLSLSKIGDRGCPLMDSTEAPVAAAAEPAHV